MRLRFAALAAGFALDALLGDPRDFPHPVRALGRLNGWLERRLRSVFPKSRGGELAGGAVFTCLVLIVTAVTALGILWAASRGGPVCRFLTETVMNYYLLAARSLYAESMKVCVSLEAGDPEGARREVSMIVGRDTAALSDIGIAKAAVETVAENTSDGVLAPLFYLAVGGPAAGWLYKAVNTMDSMVGYQNERYQYFGRAAARLDDAANYLPSRLSALLLIAAAAVLNMDAGNAWRIYRRDRRNHKSPNSAQTEAACAGALGIQLAGDASYFGKTVKKPLIGDALRPVEYGDIRRAGKLMWVAALLGLAVTALAYCALSAVTGL